MPIYSRRSAPFKLSDLLSVQVVFIRRQYLTNV